MTLYLGNNLISGTQTLVGESRNIGQIIPSAIPLTDAGLHLLDGTLINGSGIYSAFVTYISGLVSTYPDLFVTEADWQTSVTDYGVCGKFVYDSTNNTVRLPKITGKLEGTTDVSALGDLIEQFVRLPNITGTFAPYVGGDHSGIAWDNTSYQLSGAFYRTSIGNGKTSTETDGSYGRAGLGLDASRSSSVYSGDGTNTVIQPQAIKCYYYIVIATSTKTDIQVDIDEIATDLNGKADVDLGNINASISAKNEIVSWGIPDWTTQVQIPTTLNLVQQADEDVVLFGGVGGGRFRADICQADGTKIVDLFNIYNASNSYAIYNWSPIVNKGQYFKVSSVGNTNALIKVYLRK